MTVREFQIRVERIYLKRDRRRGVDGTFRWLTEEVGELARAIRHRDRQELSGEFADVFAWLASLASQLGIDLEDAAQAKYGLGCPKCRRTPCRCPAGLPKQQAGRGTRSEPPRRQVRQEKADSPLVSSNAKPRAGRSRA